MAIGSRNTLTRKENSNRIENNNSSSAWHVVHLLDESMFARVSCSCSVLFGHHSRRMDSWLHGVAYTRLDFTRAVLVKYY